MCSRFENKETGISIFKKLENKASNTFVLDTNKELKKKNIAPNDEVLILTPEKDGIHIKDYIWGIQFDKNAKSPLIFNSRIETIKEKPYWRKLFSQNRCILPATAFYEWKEINKVKIPHRISLKNNNTIFIGAIFTKLGDSFHTSMITTKPNEEILRIHNRMPVLFNLTEGIDFLTETAEHAFELCCESGKDKNVDIDYAEDLMTDRHRKALEQ